MNKKQQTNTNSSAGFTPSVVDDNAPDFSSVTPLTKSSLYQRIFSSIFPHMRTKSLPSLTAGFTILETLIAVTIFTASLTVMLVTVGQGFSSVSVSKNKLVANYLTQEGIELVRHRRDEFAAALNSNLLGQTPGVPSPGWVAFSSEVAAGGCNDVAGCNTSPGLIQGVVPSTLKFVSCGTAGSCAMTMDASPTGTGYYGFFAEPFNSLPKTAFTRTIFITAGHASSTSVVVKSTVSWVQGGNTYTSSMSELLTDWQ